MESGAFAACAGLGLGLVILQQLFFATALRGFVAEERRKRAEAPEDGDAVTLIEAKLA